MDDLNYIQTLLKEEYLLTDKDSRNDMIDKMDSLIEVLKKYSTNTLISRSEKSKLNFDHS